MAEGKEKTMSAETLQMDIDQRGKKADGISLTYGKLHRVTQSDQCPLSPAFLHSPLSGELLIFKVVLVGEQRDRAVPENTDRSVRKCSVRFFRIVGKSF